MPLERDRAPCASVDAASRAEPTGTGRGPGQRQAQKPESDGPWERVTDGRDVWSAAAQVSDSEHHHDDAT
eukprot:2567140-Rhodomonas_salina.3